MTSGTSLFGHFLWLVSVVGLREGSTSSFPSFQVHYFPRLSESVIANLYVKYA